MSCTAISHDNRFVERRQWGRNYKVNVCTSCDCTVSEPVKVSSDKSEYEYLPAILSHEPSYTVK